MFILPRTIFNELLLNLLNLIRIVVNMYLYFLPITIIICWSWQPYAQNANKQLNTQMYMETFRESTLFTMSVVNVCANNTLCIYIFELKWSKGEDLCLSLYHLFSNCNEAIVFLSMLDWMENTPKQKHPPTRTECIQHPCHRYRQKLIYEEEKESKEKIDFSNALEVIASIEFLFSRCHIHNQIRVESFHLFFKPD